MTTISRCLLCVSNKDIHSQRIPPTLILLLQFHLTDKQTKHLRTETQIYYTLKPLNHEAVCQGARASHVNFPKLQRIHC